MIEQEEQAQEPRIICSLGLSGQPRTDIRCSISTRVREYVKSFNFTKLFIEELGWDRHANGWIFPSTARPSISPRSPRSGAWSPLVASRRRDGQIPDYATRRKIERQVAKSAHEHLIIYIDRDQNHPNLAVGQARAGQAGRCREHTYHQQPARRRADPEAPSDRLQPRRGRVAHDCRRHASRAQGLRRRAGHQALLRRVQAARRLPQVHQRHSRQGATRSGMPR